MSDNYPLFVSSIPAESGYLRVPKSNNNRNMKQIICILALLLMSVTTTKAQTSPATPSIRGKILTEEKQPIKFANIALLSEDSTFIQGTCSRSDGSFELLPPAPGNYLLQVSSIGYKALCQSIKKLRDFTRFALYYILMLLVIVAYLDIKEPFKGFSQIY